MRETALARIARAVVPRPARARLRAAADRVRDGAQPRRRPRWGNLRRSRPFSVRYGFDRGTPVDRVYLDRFFSSHAADIQGLVLEVKDATFTGRHGHDVERVDLVDIDPSNADATLIADLAEPGSLPAGAYDCIVIPQTLQYVDDPAAAVANACAALRPDGVLLLSAPAAAPPDPELSHVDRWRFTPRGLSSLLERACPGADVTVEGYGTLVTTIAFLHGLAAEELEPAELAANDARYPVVSCARVQRRKPA